jgi:BlaI family transcriptional regulator, penicillinase repressor
MARPKTIGPTKRELEILQVLWEKGSSTTKEVQEALGKNYQLAYNTVQTLLLIMCEKKLVTRAESGIGKTFIFTAKQSKEDMEGKLVKSFMDNVFGGSAMRLVTRALSLEPTSKEDKEKIRQVLERGKGNEEPD